jgi:hypothetical protein
MRGGARKGAGRKTRRQARQAQCERLIDEAMTDIVAALIKLAKEGDKQVALALFYHRMGKPRTMREEKKDDHLVVDVSSSGGTKTEGEGHEQKETPTTHQDSVSFV